jgi:hypothetical protein
MTRRDFLLCAASGLLLPSSAGCGGGGNVFGISSRHHQGRPPYRPMSFTPPITDSRLLLVCDPNGGTLYSDAGATTLANVGDNVLANKDASSPSPVTAGKIGSLAGALTLQQDSNNSKYLRGLTTSNISAATGGGLQWAGLSIDQTNFCAVLLIRCNRVNKNVSDILCDVGGIASANSIQLTNSASQATTFNGSAFNTAATLMTYDADWSVVILHCVSGQMTIYRDDEISTAITRTVGAATGTTFSLLGRPAANLFCRADIGLALLYTGSISTSERNSIRDAAMSYADGLGWSRKPTSGQKAIVINGNSNAAAIVADITSLTWFQLVAAQLTTDGFTNFKVFNQSAASRQVTHCDTLLSAGVYPLFDATTARKIYLFMCGENDLTVVTPATTWSRTWNHLLSVKQHDASVKTILVVCLPRGDQGASNATYETNRQTLISSILADPTGATAAGQPVIDYLMHAGEDSVLGLASTFTTPNTSYVNADKTHLNNGGNSYLATGAMSVSNMTTVVETALNAVGGSPFFYGLLTRMGS